MQGLKKELQLAIAKVVKAHRTKSITKSADEIAMGKSLWADLENGIKDPQISTLWRIAEGLEIKPHILMSFSINPSNIPICSIMFKKYMHNQHGN